MATTPPEDHPITGVLVVADPKKCPPGYDLLYQTEDKKEDCDLWKDSFFKSRVTRYLCYTRSFPVNNCNETSVLADIVIQNEKETPPAGYTLIEHTVDTSEKATRKKQICVRMLPWSSTNQAINKLIFSKSKRPPVQYTSAGEINNLMLYYKFGPVPQTVTTNATDKPAADKPTPAPRIKIANRLRPNQSSSGLGSVNKQLNNNLYTHPLAGVPFQVNSKYVLSSGSAMPSASNISYRSYADINNENFSTMVSIPDWSKFRRLGDAAPTSQALSGNSKYYKQQAYEIIKQAEKHGYFVSPTQNLIQKCIQNQNQMQGKDRRDDQKDICLANVLTLRLPHMRLRGVGDISLCYSLRVCILNNNYIKRFDALVSCSQLIRLDLHSNQITTLPSSSFWSYMDQLQVLNLHDNPIGGIENLHYLANCSNLVALTMHDTPLSLKPNYRHHVVNSIWSLKALDHHIISDEEIIEDANFSGRFSALHPCFKVDLCPQAVAEEDEIPTVHGILRTINQLMAHVSPVLIIQRYSRGHLLRKHYKVIHDMRIWAAVTIQRKYREWKGLPSPVTRTLPPPSPVAQSEAVVKIPIEPGSFDYDTYLKNRRPGSGQLSDPYSARHSQIPSTPAENTVREEQVGNLFIDFSKLQRGDEYSGDQDVDVPVNTVRSGELSTHAVYQQERPQRQKDERKKKKKSQEPKRLKTIKHFFGPIVESTPSPTPEEEYVGGSDQRIPLVNFRLRGRKENVVFYDPTTEMLLARREAGQDVRIAEDNFHRQQMVKTRPPCKQRKPQNAQPAFARVQGTMGLTCLQAIQQAYRDREKAERSAHKKEVVLNMKDEREAAKDRLRLYQEERRHKVIQQREQEQRQVVEQMARLETERLATVERYNELRKLSSRHLQQRRDERTFIVDFSVQNTSVSNALLRHDWQARAEDQFSRKIDLVQGQKELEHEQQEVVKKYMEHRQLMRQTESAMSRAAVDTKMLQEANERLITARNRVTHLKSRNENVSTFYPLPCVSSQPLPKIPTDDKTGSLSMKHFNKWHSDKLFRYNTAAAL